MVFFIILVFGAIWGIVTNLILRNKGYEDNWFWWGFFFGIFAVIVALSKSPAPSNTMPTQPYAYQMQSGTGSGHFSLSSAKSTSDDTWKCKCGRINPSYTGTCGCGESKYKHIRPTTSPTSSIANASSQDNKNETLSNFAQIKEYKELLDSGIITSEEFEKKKKELLNI